MKLEDRFQTTAHLKVTPGRRGFFLNTEMEMILARVRGNSWLLRLLIGCKRGTNQSGASKLISSLKVQVKGHNA